MAPDICADPWSLNTPGGVIDLRSAICRRITEKMTRKTEIAREPMIRGMPRRGVLARYSST